VQTEGLQPLRHPAHSRLYRWVRRECRAGVWSEMFHEGRLAREETWRFEPSSRGQLTMGLVSIFRLARASTVRVVGLARNPVFYPHREARCQNSFRPTHLKFSSGSREHPFGQHLFQCRSSLTPGHKDLPSFQWNHRARNLTERRQKRQGTHLRQNSNAWFQSIMNSRNVDSTHT